MIIININYSDLNIFYKITTSNTKVAFVSFRTIHLHLNLCLILLCDRTLCVNIVLCSFISRPELNFKVVLLLIPTGEPATIGNASDIWIYMLYIYTDHIFQSSFLFSFPLFSSFHPQVFYLLIWLEFLEFLHQESELAEYHLQLCNGSLHSISRMWFGHILVHATGHFYIALVSLSTTVTDVLLIDNMQDLCYKSVTFFIVIKIGFMLQNLVGVIFIFLHC